MTKRKTNNVGVVYKKASEVYRMSKREGYNHSWGHCLKMAWNYFKRHGLFMKSELKRVNRRIRGG